MFPLLQWFGQLLFQAFDQVIIEIGAGGTHGRLHNSPALGQRVRTVRLCVRDGAGILCVPGSVLQYYSLLALRWPPLSAVSQCF